MIILRSLGEPGARSLLPNTAVEVGAGGGEKCLLPARVISGGMPFFWSFAAGKGMDGLAESGMSSSI